MNRGARVFISYRRSDTKWAAGRLYDRLAAVLGAENVFLDVSNIEPGKDFVTEIREVVGSCDVLLAVIGKDWLSRTGDGKRRIDSTRDLIRVEVAAALERDIRVIPILVDDADVPDEEDLPPDLAPLARRNARQVSFENFHSDMDSFIRVLERILAGPGVQPQNVAQARKEQQEARSPSPVATALPFTVCLETAGGVATPLIARGSRLPAEATEVFSTAEDNQHSVEIKLFAGEQPQAKDNHPLGTFQLRGIEPAPRGVPQIQLRATVDPSLILVVAAENLKDHRKEVLDAVDLNKVQVPEPAMKQEPAGPPPVRNGSSFKDLFAQMFGNKAADRKRTDLDALVDLPIGKSEAESGGQYTVEAPTGKIQVNVPAGIQSGSRLRVRGYGRADGAARGDLYIHVIVRP